MMRALILTALLTTTAAATSAHAATQILFARDGSKATILMLAVTQNPDAEKLFEAIKAPAQDMQGKLTKQVALTNSDGAKAAQLLCAFSKIAPGTGSCTITLNPVRGVTLESSRQVARLEAQGPEADQFAASFIAPPNGSSEVYRSSDSHVVISSSAGLFSLKYE